MLKIKQLSLRIDYLETEIADLKDSVGDLLIENARLNHVVNKMNKDKAPKEKKAIEPTAPKKRGRKPKVEK